jgi:hypothetical protein
MPISVVSRHHLLGPASLPECRCVWTLCEPQPLCRIRGAGCARRTSAARVPRCAQGSFPDGRIAHDHPGGRVDSRRLSGGIVSFAFEVAVLALLARTRKGLQGATTIGVAFVVLASIALIVWLGVGKAIERFSKTRIGDASLSRRASMFRGAEHIFLDHPVTGVGLGTIVTVFPGYDTGYDGLVVDHVHNDYIEALAETGILGGVCGIAFLCCCSQVQEDPSWRNRVIFLLRFMRERLLLFAESCCTALLISICTFRPTLYFFCCKLTWQRRLLFLPAIPCHAGAFTVANTSSLRMSTSGGVRSALQDLGNHLWPLFSGYFHF